MVQDAPDPVEVNDFKFLQLRKLKIVEEQCLPTNGLNLLATSSRYGLIFVGVVGGFKVLKLENILDCDEDREKFRQPAENYSQQLVRCSTPVLLSLSSDDMTLAVCVVRDSRVVADMYDVRAFADSDGMPLPFLNVQLSSHPAELRDFMWNPVVVEMYAYCLSDGSASVHEVSETNLNIDANLPPQTGASAVCWSPKGKQLVIGKKDGSFSQYKPNLQEVKKIQPPKLGENSVEVINMHWLSTTLFAVVYVSSTNRNDKTPSLVLVSTPKGVEPTYTNFSDVCLGSSTDYKPRYNMHYQPEWSMLVCASANAVETAVIGCLNSGKGIWLPWALEGGGRAELPIDKYKETYPLGLATIFCAQRKIYVSETESYPPMPIIFLLSTNGLLCPFHMLNIMPGAANIVYPSEPISRDGERKPKGVPKVTTEIQQQQSPPAVPAFPVQQRPIIPNSTISMTPPASATPSPFQSPPPGQSPFQSPPAGHSLFQSPPPGQPPFQSPPAGQSPFQSPPAGQSPFQSPPAGQSPFQSPPAGQSPFQSPPAGQSPFQSPPASTGQLPFQAVQTTVAQLPFQTLQTSVVPSPFHTQPATAAAPPFQTSLTIQQNVPSSNASVFKKPEPPPFQLAPKSIQSAGDVGQKPMPIQPTFAPVAPPNVSAMPAFPSFTTTSKFQSAFPGAPLPSFAIKPNVSAPAPVISGPPTAKDVEPETGIVESRSSEMPVLKPIQKTSSTVQPAPKTQDDSKAQEALVSAIYKEISGFEEIVQNVKKLRVVDEVHIGTQEEMTLLKKNWLLLTDFHSDMADTMQCLNSDIQTLKTALLESFTMVGEAESRKQRHSDHNYKSLLRERALDPMMAKKMEKIQQLYQYLNIQTHELHNKLDEDWRDLMERQKEIKRNHLRIPSTEAIYQTIVTNQNLIHNMENQLQYLSDRFKSVKLSTRPRVRHFMKMNEISTDTDLVKLADTLIQDKVQNMNDQNMAQQNFRKKKLPAAIQAALRDALSNRRITCVRPTVISNPSQSRLLSSAARLQDTKHVEPQSSATAVLTSSPIERVSVHVEESISPSPPQQVKPLSVLTVKPDSRAVGGITQGIPFAIAARQQVSSVDIAKSSVSTITLSTNTAQSAFVQVSSPQLKGDTADRNESGQETLVHRASIASVNENHAVPNVMSNKPDEAISRLPFMNMGFNKPSVGEMKTDVVRSASPVVIKYQTEPNFYEDVTPPSTPYDSQSPNVQFISGNITFTPMQSPTNGATAGTSLKPISSVSQTSAVTNATLNSLVTTTPTADVCGSNMRNLLSQMIDNSGKPYVGDASGSPGDVFVISTSKDGQAVALKVPTSILQENICSSSLETPSPGFRPAVSNKATFSSQNLFSQPGNQTSTVLSSSSNQNQAVVADSSAFEKFSVASPVKNLTENAFSDAKLIQSPVFSSENSALKENVPSFVSPPNKVVGQELVSSTTSLSSANLESKSKSVFGQFAFSASASETPAFGSVEVTKTPVFGQQPPSASASAETSAVETLISAVSSTTFGQTSPTTVSGGSFFGSVPAFSSIIGQKPATTSSFFSQPTTTQSSEIEKSSQLFGQDAKAVTTTGTLPTTTTAVASSVFGQATTTTTATTTANIFGQATPATTASVFGQATTTTTASLFGQPSVTTTASVFGQTTATTTSIFGQTTATTTASVFGQAAPTTTANIFSQITSTTANTSPNIFGQTATSVPSPFGQAAATTTTTTTTTASSIFGSPAGSSVFSQTTSATGPFGQASSGFFSQSPSNVSVFGQKDQTQGNASIFGGQSAASGFSFGKSSFGQPPQTGTFGLAKAVFGQPQSPTGSFGQESVLGQTSFFSGFGSKTDPMNATKNSFGVVSGSEASSTTGLFGNQASSAFGAKTGSFAGGSFSSVGGSVAQSGFAAFQQSPQKSSGFGSPPSFGSNPVFGGAPAFGSSPTFGGSPPGGAPIAAPAFGSAQGSFSSFAATDAPTFGSLASQSGGGGFGQQSSGFGQQQQTQSSGFGQQQQTQGSGFGQQQTQGSVFGASTNLFGGGSSSPPSFGGQQSSFGSPSGGGGGGSSSAFTQWRN